MSTLETMAGNKDLFGKGLPVEGGRPAKQLALPLAWNAPAGSANIFQISASNREAVDHLNRFAEWTSPASILVGPRGSGRTTLGLMFRDAGAGQVIDGLAQADEEALFHSWNRAMSVDERLLIIADSIDDVHAVRLPDLATRLATAPLVAIHDPDSCLIRDLVEHLLVRRGLVPAPQLGSYVAARLDRSYAALHAAVEAIDKASLAAGTQPGIRIARAALLEAGLFDDAAMHANEMGEA